MTTGLCGGFGIPSPVRKAMELLQWADWPRCGAREDYRADAALYVSLRQRIRRGKATAAEVRRGP